MCTPNRVLTHCVFYFHSRLVNNMILKLLIGLYTLYCIGNERSLTYNFLLSCQGNKIAISQFFCHFHSKIVNPDFSSFLRFQEHSSGRRHCQKLLSALLFKSSMSYCSLLEFLVRVFALRLANQDFLHATRQCRYYCY